jgi:hypothetical protein
MSGRRPPEDIRDRVRANGQGALPTTFTAAELLEMDLPPIKWAIPDILPEGVTILAGRAKIGKSFLAFGLCVAVATGGEALGHIPVGRGDVHYIALEDNKRRLKKRLRGLLNGSPAPDNLTISIEWPRLDDGGAERLDGWLTEHPDARLVVIDILKSIRPRGAAGRNIYDVDYESLEPLKPLIEKHGVSIVVVHHLNQGQSTDPLQLISGSEGLVGVVDGTLVLRRERGKHDATLHVSGKDIEDEKEHALRWDAPLTSWVLMGDAEDFRLTDQRRAIRDAMRAIGRPATIGEIAAHLDKNYDATAKLTAKMTDEGLIALHHMEGASKYFSLTTTDPNNPNGPNSPDGPNDPNTREGGRVWTPEGGEDPNTNPHSNADNGGDWTDRTVWTGEGADTGGPVREMLADPPPGIAAHLREYAKDPDRHREAVCRAVAEAALGDQGRWREVAPVLMGET